MELTEADNYDNGNEPALSVVRLPMWRIQRERKKKDYALAG